MTRYDCAVIGGGISGLTAALTLAREHRKVVLIEQHEQLAPLLRRFKRGNYVCDPGFHYTGGLEKNGLLDVLFRFLGMGDAVEAVPLPQNNFDTLVLDGRTFKLPFGYAQLKDYLSDAFPASAKAVSAYFQKITEINEQTGFLNFKLPFDRFADELHQNRSLKEFLTEAGAEPDLIRLLGGHGLVLYGANAAEVPLFVHASVMGSFYKSAHTIRGGADVFILAFEKLLEEFGVDIYVGDGVRQLEIDERRTFTGVLLESGRSFKADTCISTVHPWQLADLLPEQRVRPAFTSRLRGLENTFAPFMVFYGADDMPRNLQESNYYVLSGPGPVFDVAYMAANDGAETANRRALTALKIAESDFNGMARGTKYSKLKKMCIQSVTEQTELLFPRLKNKLQVLDAATPATFMHYTRTANGAIYGTKPTVHQRGLGPQTSVRGLYMAGQSLQSGIMGGMISAFMAVGQITGMEYLRKQVVKCL